MCFYLNIYIIIFRHIFFSEEEKTHLLYATGAFTLALGFMSAGGLAGMREGFSPWLIQVLIAMPIMLIAVGPAFVLHEIGHKIVAKKNGCWAEFRASPGGLRFGVIFAAITGIVIGGGIYYMKKSKSKTNV